MKNFEQSSGWEAKTVQPFFDSVHNTPGLICHSYFLATEMKRKQFISYLFGYILCEKSKNTFFIS